MATHPTSAVNEKERSSTITDRIFSIVLDKVPDWVKWIILFPLSIVVFGLAYEIFFVVIKAAFKEIFSWNPPPSNPDCPSSSHLFRIIYVYQKRIFDCSKI